MTQQQHDEYAFGDNTAQVTRAQEDFSRHSAMQIFNCKDIHCVSDGLHCMLRPGKGVVVACDCVTISR